MKQLNHSKISIIFLRKALAVFAFFYTTIFSVSAFAQVLNYSVIPGSKEWLKIKTHEEMIKACQIPIDNLNKISTSDLLQTCLNYPLLLDMLAFDNVKVGFLKMIERSNVFSEFMKRSDAANVVFKKYVNTKIEDVYFIREMSDKGKYTFEISVLEIMLADTNLLKNLNNGEKEILLKKISANAEKKEEYKELYGTLGMMTLLNTGVNILNLQKDISWLEFVQNDEKVKRFSEEFILVDVDTINSIKKNLNQQK